MRRSKETAGELSAPGPKKKGQDAIEKIKERTKLTGLTSVNFSNVVVDPNVCHRGLIFGEGPCLVTQQN